MSTRQSVDPSNVSQLDNWDGDGGCFWASHADRFDEAVAAYPMYFDDLRASLADHLNERGVLYDSATWLIQARRA